MPVASSSLRTEHAQADGRRWVHETHVLTAGNDITVSYLWDGNTTPADVMAARVALINEQLAAAEMEALLGGA